MIEKLISFVKIWFLFQLVPQSKSYTTKSLKLNLAGRKKNLQKVKIKFLNFFSKVIYFCLHVKLWFILFGLVMRKLRTILFWGQSKYLLKKITYRILGFIFECNFHNSSKKIVGLGYFYLLEQSHNWNYYVSIQS